MPQQFDFDADADPMDGYDTEAAEESPVQAAPPPRPVSKPAPAPAAKEVLDELEESPDPAELSDAEWRLEKAGYYRSVMNSQLLQSDHPAAIEVEQELQTWAQERLEVLLGIKSEGTAKVEVVPAKLPFTDDQVEALKVVADRVIAKQAQPVAAPAPPVAVPAPSKPQPVAPASVKPAPRIAPAPGPNLAAMPRGRGRPRKPCRICGELVCEHKKQKPPATQTTQNTPSARKPVTSDSVSGETYDGLPIQIAPDGMKFINAPDGRRYRLDVRTVTHKQTGEQRQAYVPVELTKPKMLTKAYPSEQEAMALAAAEAAKNLEAVSSISAVTTAGGIPQKLSGKALVDAAMAAPEREEYIPEPPPGKKR